MSDTQRKPNQRAKQLCMGICGLSKISHACSGARIAHIYTQWSQSPQSSTWRVSYWHWQATVTVCYTLLLYSKSSPCIFISPVNCANTQWNEFKVMEHWTDWELCNALTNNQRNPKMSMNKVNSSSTKHNADYFKIKQFSISMLFLGRQAYKINLNIRLSEPLRLSNLNIVLSKHKTIRTINKYFDSYTTRKFNLTKEFLLR